MVYGGIGVGCIVVRVRCVGGGLVCGRIGWGSVVCGGVGWDGE